MNFIIIMMLILIISVANEIFVFRKNNKYNVGVLEEIKKENKELLSEVGFLYENRLDKMRKERDGATEAMNIMTTAIKSLEPKYRIKIQHQIDRILNKQKNKPIISEKGKPNEKK